MSAEAGSVTVVSSPRNEQVQVRRSKRRRRTVSAYRDGEVTVVAIPANFTAAEERQWVKRMLQRLETRERARRPSDEQLFERARQLSARYLDGRAQPTSVAWASNQLRRWGSCTPADGSIRISTRLKGMPTWVLDYVILHELAHLLNPGHGPEFWQLLAGFERTERARGFLEGATFILDGAQGPGGGAQPGGEQGPAS